MNRTPAQGPQHTLLFRCVAVLSRLRIRYLQTTSHRKDMVTLVYLSVSGITALGTIAAMAYLTDFMLLFPPLGPSAFLLFYTPLSESASPRNLILAHAMALLAGLGALAVAQALVPETGAVASGAMNGSHVTAVALAMGAISISMVVLRCVHPPAAATALIAAMGYLENIVQVGGVLIAVLFLAMEAYLFNRLVSGLPYPFWRANSDFDRIYGPLAGHPAAGMSRWRKLADKTFQRR